MFEAAAHFGFVWLPFFEDGMQPTFLELCPQLVVLSNEDLERSALSESHWENNMTKVFPWKILEKHMFKKCQ